MHELPKRLGISTFFENISLTALKILTGHEKGILSLSWCRQDADLLLSCGKDNRALCWNPQTAEIIGELPSADNWAFQVSWCPRNPDLLATAYFDGTIGVHSLQSTNENSDAQIPVATPKPDGSDVFDVPGFSRTTQPTLSLKQPPKWLRRPVSSSFGYGGKLVTISNLPSAQGLNQSSVVHLRKVVTEPDIIQRAKELKEASDGETLREFAEHKSADAESQSTYELASWKALTSLFRTDSREELVTLLGFSKSEIAERVAEAIEKIKVVATPTRGTSDELNLVKSKPHGPVVSFAEPEVGPEPEHDTDRTPSELSASAASDHTDVTKAIDSESTTTAPSLFGDDIGTPQMEAEADFFSTMGTIATSVPAHVQIPHHNYAHDSSVAATIGSRPSSAASETVKNNTFRIYPSEESEVDRLVTKALVIGDFESAVSLCLSAERFADAILLAVKGGPELLQRTQQTYFEKRTINLPYLRLFQSIVTEDLDDIVQNADLQEWQEIFVVLCTFAKPDEFANLAEQLGQRLEFNASIIKNTESTSADDLRKNATLTYLASGKLEKLVNIWIEEMAEEEARLLVGGDDKSSSRYSAHAHSLQTFMEKVSVFRNAACYTDTDLNANSEPSAVRTYKLANLYERYYEYADLLATQGLVEEAVSFLQLIPSDYQSTDGSNLDFATARERILEAAGRGSNRKESIKAHVPSASVSSIPPQPTYGYQPYVSQAPIQTAAKATTHVPTYAAYTPSGAAASATHSNPYAPTTVPITTQPSPYQPPISMQSYAQNTYASTQPVPVSVPPPTSGPQSVGPPPPPPKKREVSGWNDAPVLDRRTPLSHAAQKAAAITSPFPNASPPSVSVPGSPAVGSLPPPPRPGSVNRGSPQLMQGPPPAGVRSSSSSQQGPPPGPYTPQGRAYSPLQQAQQPIPPPPRGPVQFTSGPPPGQHAPPRISSPQAQFNAPPRGPGMPPAGSGVPNPYARADVSGWSGPDSRPVQPVNIGGAPVAPPPGPYGPPPMANRQMPPPSSAGAPPPPSSSGITHGAPTPQAPPSKQGPPQPKYRKSTRG